jgi:hypothetical protein
MEPRAILIKPAYLPVLPGYQQWLRNTRAMTRLLVLQPILFAALFLYLDFSPALTAIGIGVPLVGILALLGLFARLRKRIIAVTTGEIPAVSAHEVDGGWALRGVASPARGGLVVRSGDTVRVTVAPGVDPRKRARPSTWVTWSFATSDNRSQTGNTFFDPDQALLRDVERRLSGLGVSAEISHTPVQVEPVA